MKHKTQRTEGPRRWALGLAIVVALGTAVPGVSTASESLAEQSLEDFLNSEITSVSKKAQRLVEAPSAVFVITSEDIRRSGFTSIPEVLRLAPGLQVGRANSYDWRVTSRGFNSEFATKLLVLVDGLSLYSHLRSHVPWDINNVPLDDIERIEVIRGPGGAVWGANAVNGVINIITKSAEHTQDSLVSLGVGNHDRIMTTVRTGGRLGDDAHYRLTGHYLNTEELETPAGADFGDSWRRGRTGMRFDWSPSAKDSVMLTWNYYAGDHRSNERIDQVVPGSGLPFPIDPLGFFALNAATDVRGGDAIFRWNRQLSEHESTEFKFQYDQRVREAPRTFEKRRNFDLAFQHQFRWNESHDLIWGAGAMVNFDRLHDVLNLVFSDDSGRQATYSAFFQDDISLVPDRFNLTLGSKVEWNDVTGWELQPSARFLWTPASNQQVWGSLSRAVRVPARTEREAALLLANVLPAGAAFCPPGPPPPPFPPGCPIAATGNPDLDKEVVVAAEAGYRYQPSSKLALDFATFYNDYDDIAEVVPSFGPGPSINLTFLNRNRGHSYGLEASVQWAVSDWWKLAGSYTGLQVQTRFGTLEKEGPHHQFSIHSMMNLPGGLELDTWFYFVGRTEHVNATALGSVIDVDSNLRADVRLGWQPRPGLELSLVGQDLFDDEHEEFPSAVVELNPIATIERRFYGKVTWSF